MQSSPSAEPIRESKVGSKRYPKSIGLGASTVGDESPTFIVAELSANHNHDLNTALRTIDAAAEAGANAVKLQTYTPDTITFPSDSKVFQVSTGSVWDGRTLYDLYAEAHTPWDWHPALFDHARDRGLVCFSSPFDPSAVELLESLESPAYKVASFEITDTPLIERIATTGKPIVISTGIATADEISAALDACQAAGNDDVILLKCTSAYPAKLNEANLRTMVDMRSRFGPLVGLSDHTTDHLTATTATALGACLVEKHLILERSMGGPDAGFSLEPHEFAEMVRLIRATESALGTVTYDLTAGSQESRQFARSLFVVRDVGPGDVVTESNVRSIRPSNGLPPGEMPALIGRHFVTQVPAGTPLAWLHVESDHRP